MNPLNKIILTGLSVLSFNYLYSQDKDSDSLLKECNVQIKTRDNLVSEQLKAGDNYYMDFRKYAPIFSSQKVYSKNLRINLNERVYYVTKKNEEDGVDDLIKICGEGYEEAWLYLPKKQTWYEIGVFSDSNSVRPFTPRIKEILEENKDTEELIFYHNHPGGHDQPSISDMIMAVYMGFSFFPNHKIINKIIAKGETIEYSLSNKGKKELENELKKRGYFGILFMDGVYKYFDINCTTTSSLDIIK